MRDDTATLPSEDIAEIPIEKGLVYVTTARIIGRPKYGMAAGGPEYDRGARTLVEFTVPNGMECVEGSVLLSREFVDHARLDIGDELVVIIGKKQK